MSMAYWDYSGLHGEHTWKDSFPMGLRQSPINIKTSDAIKNLDFSKSPLSFANTGIALNLENKGNNVSFQPIFMGDGVPSVSGGPLTDQYCFHECHFHWGRNNNKGSEHEIDGLKFDAELHLVHRHKGWQFGEALNRIDGLCVLGIFLEIDDNATTPPFFRHMLRSTKHVHYKGEQHVDTDHLFNPYNTIKPIVNNYFTYEGSLTTPPLSECVRWIVFKDPVKVKPEDFSYFHDICAVKSEENTKCHYDPFSRSSDCQCTSLPKIGDNYRSCCQDAGRKVEMS